MFSGGSSSVILEGLTKEEFSFAISEVKAQLLELKKDLSNREAYNDLLTREETCEFLKINSSTLWAWTNKGKVNAYGIGSRRYYKKSELLNSLKLVKSQSQRIANNHITSQCDGFGSSKA